MKTKDDKKGISLILLIITILVVIILAAAVLLTLSKNNPIESSKEARFKEDVRTFQDELALTVSKQYALVGGHRDTKITTSDFDEIKEYIPSFSEKYRDKFVIANDELVYTFNVTEVEKKYLASLNTKKYVNYTQDGLQCELDAKDLNINSTEWKDRTTGKKFQFVNVTINDDVAENGLLLSATKSEQKLYYLYPVVENYSPLTLEFYGELLEPVDSCYRLIITTRGNTYYQANICYGNSLRPVNQRGIYTDMATSKIFTSQYLDFPCNKHIIITYNNKIVKIYCDGELVKVGETTSMPVHDAVMLGGWNFSAEKTNAYYKVVRIYNRELTQNEVMQNYLYNKSEWND